MEPLIDEEGINSVDVHGVDLAFPVTTDAARRYSRLLTDEAQGSRKK
jgi:hypothetical protein